MLNMIDGIVDSSTGKKKLFPPTSSTGGDSPRSPDRRGKSDLQQEVEGQMFRDAMGALQELILTASGSLSGSGSADDGDGDDRIAQFRGNTGKEGPTATETASQGGGNQETLLSAARAGSPSTRSINGGRDVINRQSSTSPPVSPSGGKDPSPIRKPSPLRREEGGVSEGSRSPTLLPSSSSDSLGSAAGGRKLPLSPMRPSLSTRALTSSPPPQLSTSRSFSERLPEIDADPRMPRWIKETSEDGRTRQRNALITSSRRRRGRHSFEEETEVVIEDDEEEDGIYTLGTSRTLIIHNIVRGNWTWCTAWSPEGDRLAVATENHHLAVIDTTESTVWKVRHDRRIQAPARNDSTHSIRSIAWGQDFIAVGGTGDAVSILSSMEPYHILHVIKGTGFVGSLHWRFGSSVLAIGSREDQCLIVDVVTMATAVEEDVPPPLPPAVVGAVVGRRIVSSVLCTLDKADWVNAVQFSPGGTMLAVGDRSGQLSVYVYVDKRPESCPELSHVKDFSLDDSILSIEWSSDGAWLYAGGEDYSITVVNVSEWTLAKKIKRGRWVQFIASSNSGTHVAVGGVAEVAILDVAQDWKVVKSIRSANTIPLSASWHPRDQCLAISGQDNSIVAVETVDARYVKGHYLRSTSAILACDFSPNGRMLVVGNEDGVVSFFSTSSDSFITIYELVLGDGGAKSIRWSPDGKFVVVGGGDVVIIINTWKPKSRGRVPPSASGFSVRKVIRGIQVVESICIDHDCQAMAVSAATTKVLDASAKYECIQELNIGVVLASAWCPDGTLFATIGRGQSLTIYDATTWRIIFTLKCEEAGLALAWGPSVTKGLQYLAYGGVDKKVRIIEIRTYEETWETVLTVPRDAYIFGLDWNNNGMLAVAVGDGTATIIDMAYLLSGRAVNEMDYNWQRQGMTCFTEIRRNHGKNTMRCVRWMPSTAAGTGNLLAVGGSDGILEIIDLTERKNCQAFKNCTMSGEDHT